MTSQTKLNDWVIRLIKFGGQELFSVPEGGHDTKRKKYHCFNIVNLFQPGSRVVPRVIQGDVRVLLIVGEGR